MKRQNNKIYLNINNLKDLEFIKFSMMDDGDWEYYRCGIGEYGGRVFIVDLDDSGEMYRELIFTKEGLGIEEVLNIGCECGVWREIDWGYDEKDRYRVCDEEGDWELFNMRVGV